MNLANASIAQVMIPVEDFDRGISFYRDTLGLSFLFTAPPQMAFFMCGPVRLLVGVLPPGQRGQRGGGAIYFQVSDLQGVFVSLQAKGVQFQAGPHVINRGPRSELWLAEFKDPDGNQLALMSEVPIAAS